MFRGAALAAAIVSVAACTLPGDDFSSVDVDVSAVQGTGVEAPDSTALSPSVSDVVEVPESSASCTDSSECASVQSCIDGKCVVRDCLDGEDVSACPIQ